MAPSDFWMFTEIVALGTSISWFEKTTAIKELQHLYV
jgi:hypothetical protein